MAEAPVVQVLIRCPDNPYLTAGDEVQGKARGTLHGAVVAAYLRGVPVATITAEIENALNEAREIVDGS
jgi:hypothetical protein